eukprot:TRINITY_DN4678_c0_g1_i2.p1 TRINITY_DN4678_c0_g1~~TRINITY_DN4678_c0_g1_i2.p1  ORF type:complete len:286 (-),score=71.24 TRINITY_DN4678_c0_g1_i2:85-942(-)
MLLNGLFHEPLEHLWLLYVIASSCLLFSCGVAVLAVRGAAQAVAPSFSELKETEDGADPEWRMPAEKAPRNPLGLAQVVWRELSMPPYRLLRVLCVQFFTWLALFTPLILLTAWFAASFYAGDADRGDNAGSVAFLGQAAVQLATSLGLVTFMRRVYVRGHCGNALRFVWGTTLLPLPFCSAALFALVRACGNPPVFAAQLLWALTGVATAGANTFPFAAVGNFYASDPHKGLMMGLLNVSVVLPQLIDMLLVGLLQHHVSIDWCLPLSAVFGLCACIACLGTLA